MSHAKIDKQITSSTNDMYRDWLDCLTSKGIRKHGAFFIAGEKAVAETMKRYPNRVRSLVISATQTAETEIQKLIVQTREATKSNDPRFTVIELSKELFNELDVSGTHAPLLLVHAPEIVDADLTKEPVGLEILCALGDPSNVGALLRSAAAFGASKVILLKESASPFHPKAVRGASATTLITKLERGPSINDLPALLETGKAKGPVVALDMFGTSLRTYTWPHCARLLVGEEGVGIPTSNAFTTISIPMQSGVESLNATVAISIALHSFYTQMQT
ncbi:MAG TPA: TrmH family RNA methyltransferase [Bdellovibrionales bacterium]|nr:TrmH family RNA methyltransferase [Bdellovibrionales bacterium]